MLCIYRTGPLTNFFSDLDALVGELFIKFEHFLICGDVNIHLEKVSAHRTEFYRILSSYGLNQLVNQPTHKANHLLDVVISSHKVVTSDSVLVSHEALDKLPSCDHFPLIFSLEQQPSLHNTKKVIQFRNFHKIDLE